MKKLLLLAFIIGIITSCNNGGRTHTTKTITKTVKVHVYKTHPAGRYIETDDQKQPSYVADDSWIYWYIINSNNNSYYYYSSPTPVTNFTNISFQSSTSFPVIAADGSAKPVEEPEMEVPSEEVASIEANVAPTEVESIETTTETTEPAESNESTSEGNSESSNSDAGDAGDGGGGDGGGGGD